MQHALDRADSALPEVQVRRVVAILLVLVVGVVLWLWQEGGGAVSPSSQMSTHQLPDLGIEFDYPSNWHLQEFDDYLGLASMTGALVSNVEHDFEHPDLGEGRSTSAWDMRALPEDLIVVSFEQLDRHNLEAKRTRGLPLDLEGAVVSHDAKHEGSAYGAPQPRLFLPFSVTGHLNSGAQVFIGDVGAYERDVVERILASVRPIGG